MGQTPAPLPWFLLCVSGAAALCGSASPAECRAAGPVPGADLAGEGYDVVTSSAKGTFVVDVESWQRPNGSCTLCLNPEVGSGARQRLPLAIVDWRVQRSCRRSLSGRLFQSTSEVIKWSASALGANWYSDLKIPKSSASLILAGSHSKAARFAQHKNLLDRYTFAGHSFLCRLYRYRLKDPPPLAAQFSADLSRIPNTTDQCAWPHFRRLVRTYGTHYIRSVDLGGSIQETTAIRTCLAVADGVTAEEVKDCLRWEAALEVSGEAKASARSQLCRQRASTLQQGATFHQAFSERLVEMVGGRSKGQSDLLFSTDPSVFSGWLESLTVSPGVVGYRLTPLYHLLAESDHRRSQLRDYLAEYILSNALKRNCSQHTCPAGSRKDSCSCLCLENRWLDRQCCPKLKGTGRLKVLVKRGYDLRGDFISGTDGYVVVSYGQNQARTSVISNNNNPCWQSALDLGNVVATDWKKLSLKVYDSDVFKDELLGACEGALNSGGEDHTCYLKHGKVVYRTTFTCGPHLEGSTCRGYTAYPGGPHLAELPRANRSLARPDFSPSDDPAPNVLYP
ncbi:perforin-1-like [Narcine bancroftii]|uniref:perforin-1-like n=1 Tax=Narcine bancroftii TaxID=1343680 RepID=UPI00383176E2